MDRNLRRMESDFVERQSEWLHDQRRRLRLDGSNTLAGHNARNAFNEARSRLQGSLSLPAHPTEDEAS